jgi:hypothetical protein
MMLQEWLIVKLSLSLQTVQPARQFSRFVTSVSLRLNSAADSASQNRL